MEEKIFIIHFNITPHNIQTKMSNKNVSPQEAIGLLEMAKSQILENLAQGRKQVFESWKRGD